MTRSSPFGFGRARAGMAGNTLVGFMIGLLCGLTIAVVVAAFITRSPVPFVNKASRAPDRSFEQRPAAELPDPNKPLHSKNRPAASVPAPVAEPAPEAPQDRASILDRLFGRTPEPAPAAPAPQAAPARPASAQPDTAKGSDAERSGYLLQAGAFRSQNDADAMRGRLALVGFEARVNSVEVNGQTMYRVRIGPYAQLDDVNKVRARLAENGIEASVVRLR